MIWQGCRAHGALTIAFRGVLQSGWHSSVGERVVPLDALFVVEHGLNVPCASSDREAAELSTFSFCQEASGRLPGKSNTITVKRCIIYSSPC